MQGFLPTGMWQQQHEYYVHMGSQKQGITWGIKLRKKIIEASHSLLTKRNTFEHDINLHGLIEVEDIRLKTAIKEQYNKGITGLRISYRYLFNNSMLNLWLKKRNIHTLLASYCSNSMRIISKSKNGTRKI